MGNHYEVTNGVATKYYYFGKQRVAMKVGNVITFLHSDHLGSTSITTNASGACTSAQWYYAYGNIRTPAPPTPCSGTLPTDFTFTGQRRDASAGLMYYGTQGIYGRYYDSTLGHFTQADMLVPDRMKPQTLNRYSYTFNNPLRYTDPNGHCPWCLIPLAGAVVGGGADLIVQMRFEGKSLNNIDWGQTGGAATGGAVFTSVMVMAPPTMVGVIGVGAVAGVLSGRIDDVTNASLDELWNIYNGGTFDQRRWLTDMQEEGIMSEIDDDMVAGAVAGLTGRAINNFLISKGLMDSPATKTTLQNLQRRITENNIKWDAGLKKWVSESSSRRIIISESEWAAMFGATSREAYKLLSDLLSTLFGNAAKEQYQEIPEVEGL